MKNTITIITSIFVLAFWGCEEPTEPDKTPPSVTITSPVNGAIVFEVVTITCVATDNEGVSKVQLWIDGYEQEGIEDSQEPYELKWNTTSYDDGSAHSITVRAYDTSENKTDSEPITLIVDNSGSYPNPISIGSITFSNGSFTITWNQSTDGDFSSYELEKSVESTMGDYDTIYSTENVSDTSYVDGDVDPLIYQYYRISVIDTLGYETKSQIVSSSLDPIPAPVDVTLVTYTTEEMTVEWEGSAEDDFRDYILLYSEIENGGRDTLVAYTDKSTISHILTDFDPTHENWFWVSVTDTFGQSSIGSGLTNTIDSSPTTSALNPIVYENGSFFITWSQSNDEDFQSYTLYESLSEDMSDAVEIYSTSVIDELSYTVTGVNPGDIKYYIVRTEDHWGLTSDSNIQSIIATTVWHRTYEYFGSDWGNSAIEVDGNYRVIRQTTSSFNLLNIDIEGELSNGLGSGGYGNKVLKSADNSLYIIGGSGNSLNVTKLDIDGTYIWSNQAGSNSWGFGGMLNPSGEGVIAYGQADGGATVYLVDSNGDVESVFEDEFWDRTKGIVFFDNGYYIALSRDYETKIVEVNENFEIISQNYVNGYCRSLSMASDGNLLLTLQNNQNNHRLILYNPIVGTTIWTHNERFLYDAFEYNGIYYALGGNADGLCSLLIIDMMGLLESNIAYGPGILSNYCLTSDNGILLTGTSSYWGDDESNLIIYKTDLGGNTAVLPNYTQYRNSVQIIDPTMKESNFYPSNNTAN